MKNNSPSQFIEILKNTLGVFILLSCIALQIYWNFLNKGLPISDGGDHFRIAYLIYLNISENLHNGIKFVFHTEGKPILFSLFAAPLIPLFKINQNLPIALTSIFVYLITFISYLKLFKNRFDFLSSVIITSAILTSPFLFSISTQFMPEIIWQMWFILFLYFIAKSNLLSNTLPTILSSIFFALFLLARPIESFIFILPVSFYVITYLYINNVIKIKLITASIIYSALMIILSSYLNSIHNDIYTNIYILLASSIMVLTASRKICGNNIQDKNLVLFFIIFNFIICIWLAGYAKAIFYWAFDNSFGNGAQINDNVNSGRSLLSIFMDILSIYGIQLFTIVIIFYLFNLILIIKNKKITATKTIIFLTLFSSILVFLLAYKISGTSDNRRILITMSLVFIFSSYSVCENEKLKKYFICSLFVLSVIQLLTIFAGISNNKILIKYVNNIERNVGALSYTNPILNKQFDNQVIANINKLGITDSKVAVFSLGMFSKDILYQAESLRYVTLDIDKSLEFGAFWGYAQYETIEETINRLYHNDYKYILIEDFLDAFSDKNLEIKLQSHTYFIKDILKLIHNNEIEKIPQLSYIDEFNILNRKQYIFKINYNTYKITTSSQLNKLSADGIFESKQPGWHSSINPSYPQSILIDLNEETQYSLLMLLHQDKNIKRFIKNFTVYVSNDNIKWEMINKFNSNCKNEDNIWNSFYMGKKISSRYLKLVIHSNCGDPDLLTLRGIKIE